MGWSTSSCMQPWGDQLGQDQIEGQGSPWRARAWRAQLCDEAQQGCSLQHGSQSRGSEQSVTVEPQAAMGQCAMRD